MSDCSCQSSLSSSTGSDCESLNSEDARRVNELSPRRSKHAVVVNVAELTSCTCTAIDTKNLTANNSNILNDGDDDDVVVKCKYGGKCIKLAAKKASVASFCSDSELIVTHRTLNSKKVLEF